MSRNRVHDFDRLAVPFSKVGAQHGVGALLFVTDRLADIMKQGAAFGQLHVQPQLSRHNAADKRRLTAMIEVVLSVTEPILQPTQKFDEVRVEIRETDSKDD